MAPAPDAESERISEMRERNRSELQALLASLWRRKLLIAACAVLAGGLAFAYALSQPNRYSATSTLLFRDPGFDQKLFGAPSFVTDNDPTREAATNIRLVSLDAVAERAAGKLDDGLSATQISSEANIAASGDSNLASIKATDTDPQRAADIANAFATAYVAFRRDADQHKVAEARKQVERDYAKLDPTAQAGQEGASLPRQMSQLSTLEALQTGNAEVVQQAEVPTAPSSPTPFRDAFLAGILGLFLGLGMAFLFERLDRRIRNVDELESTFGMPLLATIPDSKALNKQNGNAGVELPHSDREAFQMLRMRLRYFNVDKDIKSVLVTSASPRDGKSTVAWNLASTAASAGTRTILLELDFHHPTVAARRGLDPIGGISEALTDQISPNEAIQRVVVEERSNGTRHQRTLDVVCAGACPPNPAELVDSRRMSMLLSGLSINYDLVVLDAPPVTLVADAIPLLKRVDGIIVVGQIGKSTRDEAAQLREQLNGLGAPVLGLAANRLRAKRGYGYGYYYADGPARLRVGSG